MKMKTRTNCWINRKGKKEKRKKGKKEKEKEGKRREEQRKEIIWKKGKGNQKERKSFQEGKKIKLFQKRKKKVRTSWPLLPSKLFSVTAPTSPNSLLLTSYGKLYLKKWRKSLGAWNSFIVLTKGVLQKAELDTVWQIVQFASFLPSDEVNWLPPSVTWPLEKAMLADSRQREEILRALMEHLTTRNLVSIVPKGIKISTSPTSDEKYCFLMKAKPHTFEDEVSYFLFKRKRISPALNLTSPFIHSFISWSSLLHSEGELRWQKLRKLKSSSPTFYGTKDFSLQFIKKNSLKEKSIIKQTWGNAAQEREQ